MYNIRTPTFSRNPDLNLLFLFQTIHAFVGSVALAGAEDGLWAVEGGNWKLVEKLLEASNATIIDAKVKNNNYSVDHFALIYLDR